MHVLFLSPEVWPFSHVGGLSEVSHDLPLALGRAGHEVAVITPGLNINGLNSEGLKDLDIVLDVPVSYSVQRANVYLREMGPGVNAYLIGHENMFDRDGLYGNQFGDYEDNAERFVFFSRACLELAKAMDWQVDIVHANDWTTGLVPLYMRTIYKDAACLRKAASVFTVHNIGKQGVFWHYDMPLTGLGWECFTPELIEFYGKINFLKAGLVASDMITTVSETYLRDILTKELGFGLEGVLDSRRDRLVAITNGVDFSVWDPATDGHLAANYDAANLESKKVCQVDVRRHFGLELEGNRPVLAVLGNLLERKGTDLVADSADEIIHMGFDLVVMGFGDNHFHDLLDAAAKRHPKNMGLWLGFETELAHKIIAGADMILMPSRYEPCGLHQMHGMRYGTVPIVRRTGGLADTVADYEESHAGNGFVFDAFSSEAMLTALARAKEVFSTPQRWRDLILRGMNADFSWNSAVVNYDQVYRRAVELHNNVEEAPSHD